MKKCLVLGVNGQDGSYVAEELITRGYKVYGIGRQKESKWVKDSDRFSYIPLNLCDIDAYNVVLKEISPDIICHFAATHGSAGFIYEAHWQENLTVNSIITQATLEFQRVSRPDSYLYYLSSSKAFADIQLGLIDENTTRTGSCLYSIAKNLSTDLIYYYRNKHSLHACVFWTFNHESPRRGDTFFIPSIVRVLAHALKGQANQLSVNTLDFWCDWGGAREYMSIIADLVQKNCITDMIIATGQPIYARNFVEKLFAHFQLNANDYILSAEKIDRSSLEPVTADISRLKKELNIKPIVTIQEICFEILEEKYLIDIDKNVSI